MKAADQYGTGVVVMMSGESKLDEPLDLNRIRKATLPHCTTLTAMICPLLARNYDIYSPFYGQPEWYFVHPAHASAPFTVHRSRVLRFDGIRPPTKVGLVFTTRISALVFWCRLSCRFWKTKRVRLLLHT